MRASLANDTVALWRRILLIANTGWYLRNFRASLIERLEARGFEVVLAALPDAETEGEFFRKRRFEPLGFSRKGRNPFLEILAIVRFAKLFRRLRPDLVLTWTPKPNIYSGIAGRLLGITVIPNVSGLGFIFIRRGIFARVVGWLYRFAFKRSPIVFFQNEEDRQLFIDTDLVDHARTQKLPGSGVDLQHFGFQPLPKVEPLVFLYVGRLLADKGLRELVAAAEMLRRSGRHFVLRFAGFLDPGNPSAISPVELDKWIGDRTVEYLGPLVDVRSALVAAHCVVLPSYREGVPRSLLEAAAMGRPIITTDAPGCREAVVAGESGLLCRPKDAVSLAACMARVLDSDLEKLAEMGQIGRKHVEQYFSEDLVLSAYLSHCEALKFARCAGSGSRKDT